MKKFKLEYIWLDGYEPVPNLRGKTKVGGVRKLPDARRVAALGLRRQLDAPGRGQQLGLHAEARRDLSRTRPGGTRRSSCARCMLPDGTPHPSNTRARHPGRPGYVVRLRAGVLSLPRRRAARLPGWRRLPGPAGRVLHRRRVRECRRRRTRDRRRPPRSLPRSRHQPRGHQRRGRQGAVGVPGLRQGLEESGRRRLDRALPACSASASATASM